MIRRKVVILFLSALAWLAVAPSPVAAEWFADLLVGLAFTQSDDVRLTPPGLNIRLKEVDFHNSVSFGGRLGYWFESTPYVGFAFVTTPPSNIWFPAKTPRSSPVHASP